jgi:hypothetical protein
MAYARSLVPDAQVAAFVDGYLRARAIERVEVPPLEPRDTTIHTASGRGRSILAGCSLALLALLLPACGGMVATDQNGAPAGFTSGGGSCSTTTPPCVDGESLGSTTFGACEVTHWACPGNSSPWIADRGCQRLQISGDPDTTATATEFNELCGSGEVQK